MDNGSDGKANNDVSDDATLNDINVHRGLDSATTTPNHFELKIIQFNNIVIITCILNIRLIRVACTKAAFIDSKTFCTTF